MTRLEARIRAGAIWGHDRIVHLTLREDGGADVELKPTPRTSPDGDGLGAREWGYTYHVLDAEGHPICHAACQPDPKDR
jgi:hypothetical protein